MQVIWVGVLAVAALLAVGLLFIFARPRVPLVVLCVAFVCSMSAVSALLLLPLTVQLELPPWFCDALYWEALLVGWLGVETLCRALDAGEFSRMGQAAHAVRDSLRLYALVGVLLVLAAGYLLLWVGVSLSSLQGAVALLVNGYGLLVVAVFQGIGLVELPRTLWQHATPRNTLSALCYTLAVTDQEHATAAKRLQDALHRVAAADSAAPPPASRAEAERDMWDSLLRTARAAAAAGGLKERGGTSGGLTMHLRSAWAQTLGTPQRLGEAAMAKLRRCPSRGRAAPLVTIALPSSSRCPPMSHPAARP